jgi:outer membrane protein TolC
MSRTATAFLVSALFCIVPLAHTVADENTPDESREISLDELVARAPEWSLAVRRAEQTVREAAVDLAARPGWDASTLALSGGYRSSATAPWSAGTEIEVQPVPQLSLGAGTSLSLGGDDDPLSTQELTATVRPLEARRDTWREDRAYRQAVVRLDEERRSVVRSVETAALEVILQRSRVALAARVRDLRREEYDVELRRQSLGSASFRDVQDRQVDLIEARRAAFSAQQELLRDEAALARIVALADRKVLPAPVTLDQLRAWTDRRRERVATHEGTGALTAALLLAEIELAATEAELRRIPRVEPDLSLSGAVSIPSDRREATTTAGITLRLSPSQWRGSDRTRLAEGITLLRLEVAAERAGADLERELALQSIGIVENALAVAELQLERDREAVREAELLVSQGSRTSLELEQLRINADRAEIAVYEAATEVYTTMGAYLDLVGERTSP